LSDRAVACEGGELREVATDDAGDRCEDHSEGDVVVFLEVVGPRLGDLSVVNLLHVCARLNHLTGDLVAHSQDEVVALEVYRIDASLAMAGDIQSNALRSRYGELASTSALCGILVDTCALADDIMSSVLEEHAKDCGHDRTPVTVADANTEDLLDSHFGLLSFLMVKLTMYVTL